MSFYSLAIFLSSIGAVVVNDVIELDLLLSATEICREEPISLVWHSHRLSNLRTFSIHDEQFRMTITNAEGKEVATSMPRVTRHIDNWHFLWSSTGWKGDNGRPGERVFHKWCNTGLPPGEYNVICELAGISLPESPGSSVSRNVPITPPARWCIPLTVTERDPSKIQQAYEGWLDLALGHWSKAGNPIRQHHATEMVVYGEGELALPFKLRLIRETDMLLQWRLETGHLLDIFSEIIALDNPEVVEELIEIIRAGTVRDKYMTDVLVWGIHEMHDQGDEAIKAVTADFVQTHPRPRDPRPVPGLD